MRRKEPVFAAPNRCHGHAAGNEAKELGKFAARYVFRLHPLNGKINFGRGLLGQ
jgi:hypothetical protein